MLVHLEFNLHLPPAPGALYQLVTQVLYKAKSSYKYHCAAYRHKYVQLIAALQRSSLRHVPIDDATATVDTSKTQFC